jgi:hypothetical protein
MDFFQAPQDVSSLLESETSCVPPSTKLVATLGPACRDVDTLCAMLEAGMQVRLLGSARSPGRSIFSSSVEKALDWGRSVLPSLSSAAHPFPLNPPIARPNPKTDRALRLQLRHAGKCPDRNRAPRGENRSRGRKLDAQGEYSRGRGLPARRGAAADRARAAGRGGASSSPKAPARSCGGDTRLRVEKQATAAIPTTTTTTTNSLLRDPVVVVAARPP